VISFRGNDPSPLFKVTIVIEFLPNPVFDSFDFLVDLLLILSLDDVPLTKTPFFSILILAKRLFFLLF
jgi:hypothetical protein